FVGMSLESAIADVNPVLRGWGQYYRYGNSSRKFDQIDRYVHERLAIRNDGLHWPRRDGLKWLHLASVVVGVDVA
ncbi:MAG: group II intron maturase-specific domain-containing protein, partial [Solirubrobacteraceae bacterium]